MQFTTITRALTTLSLVLSATAAVDIFLPGTSSIPALDLTTTSMPSTTSMANTTSMPSTTGTGSTTSPATPWPTNISDPIKEMLMDESKERQAHRAKISQLVSEGKVTLVTFTRNPGATPAALAGRDEGKAQVTTPTTAWPTDVSDPIKEKLMEESKERQAQRARIDQLVSEGKVTRVKFGGEPSATPGVLVRRDEGRERVMLVTGMRGAEVTGRAEV